MFGGLGNFVQSQTIGPPPKDVPPPTPIRLPQCNPQLADASDGRSEVSVVRLLQKLHRPGELSEAHFAALGVHVHTDAPAEDVVPNPVYLPSATGWDGVDLDEARRRDDTFRRRLSHGGRSPEARVYLERRAELSVANQTAFRTIRRIKPEAGEQPARLGSTYEFYKQMEMMCAYWDDTSLPPPSTEDEEPPPPLPPRPTDASADISGQAVAAPESNARSEAEPVAKSKSAHPERVTYRTSPGNQMPPELRHNFITAFVKLVAYDFACNVIPPRVEPRLQLVSPPSPPSSKSLSKGHHPPPQPQISSYFPSGCVFLCKLPTTREDGRAGLAFGPVAAVSARNPTNFGSAAEANVDFGRELVAALVTAQHRAREGKPETRFGEGKWWATERRWGGGEGGPIGREVDGDMVVGDKDGAPGKEGDGPASPSSAQKPSSSSSSEKTVGSKLAQAQMAMRGQPASKKPRKNMSIYDMYRMVRLPTSTWDRKMRYQAVGKAAGAGYDDVFVLSSLFHHFSVLRVRVPDRLLDVLGGAPDGDEQGQKRSWGKLEMWRSSWFDLFVPEERLEAMRLLWGVMAWIMRKDPEEAGEDVNMKDV
ncbi:hypothetical protein F4821DRAFT_92259 [Hypoxylon rubiginosum]|uniref:Uncharacterized protein n=1 Tax=Hypoxylon rubiginosum TaxID=110542 RepID=A0ACC0D695_9PEZI|nr:hypothetical protein F4821DRAFT_92259 [Hypoxylon rubiginosum]